MNCLEDVVERIDSRCIVQDWLDRYIGKRTFAVNRPMFT